MSVRVCFNNAACVFVAKLYILILVKIRTPSIPPPPFFSLNAFWGQIKGAYGALFLPLAMTEGVLPKPSCIWVKPPHGCLLLACSIPSCVYVFSLYVQFFAILKLRASTKVCRLKCVLSECRLDLRRTGLVKSSIWEGSARHSPLFALRFRPPQHIVLLLHEMDSKREWNGRFGTQVTKTLGFRVRRP